MLGSLWSQKQPWGYVLNLQLGAGLRLGLQQLRGTQLHPSSAGFDPCPPSPLPLSPCAPAPSPAAAAAAVVSASPCRQRLTLRSSPPFPGSRSSGIGGPSPPNQRCLLLDSPAVPFSLSPASFGRKAVCCFHTDSGCCVCFPVPVAAASSTECNRQQFGLPLPLREVPSSVQAPSGLTAPFGHSLRFHECSPQHLQPYSLWMWHCAHPIKQLAGLTSVFME